MPKKKNEMKSFEIVLALLVLIRSVMSFVVANVLLTKGTNAYIAFSILIFVCFYIFGLIGLFQKKSWGGLTIFLATITDLIAGLLMGSTRLVQAGLTILILVLSYKSYNRKR